MAEISSVVKVGTGSLVELTDGTVFARNADWVRRTFPTVELATEFLLDPRAYDKKYPMVISELAMGKPQWSFR